MPDDNQPYFDAVFNHSFQFAVILDFQGTVLKINDLWADVCGKYAKNVIGTPFWEAGWWKEFPEVRDHTRQALEQTRQGRIVRDEAPFLDKAGSTRMGARIFSPVRNHGGDIVQFFVSGLDITEKRQKEQALVKSEQKWRNILVNTPQIGISLDPSGCITFANEHFIELTGWPRQEILGRDWFDLFIPANIREEIRNVFMTTISQKNTEGFSTFENQIKTRTGGLRNIAWSNVLTKDIYGNIKDITCLGTDLTERILAENALKESEAKYRSMMESMDEAAYICSPDFIVEYLNPAMIKKIGRDATGETCYRAIHNLQTQCAWCQHPRVMQGETVKTELPVDINGETFFMFHSPICHTDGSISKLSIYRDVTLIKQLEARLQQSQKMESVGTLAGGIAHDFNNILFPIMGLAELLVEDLPCDSQEAESAREIFKAGKRGRDLVRQILSFSRQSDRKVMPLRVQRVLSEALALGRATIPSDIAIKESIQEDCGKIMAESTQLHQIIMNLLTNAWHAVEPTGGHIRVELSETLEPPFDNAPCPTDKIPCARIIVEDTGVGIPHDLMNKIFDPYFTTKERGKGTGLGLATVYGIARKFNGEIKVTSAPGKGTTFKIYFPVIENEAENGIDPSPAGAPGGHEHILVVDDEEPIALLEKTMLQRAGYRVTVRTGSVDAFEKFKAAPESIDLVLTDMTMPNMTGDRLAEKILTIRPDIPIVICTGFSGKIDRRKAERLGIRGFLKKPIVRTELRQMVRDLLDKRP